MKKILSIRLLNGDQIPCCRRFWTFKGKLKRTLNRFNRRNEIEND